MPELAANKDWKYLYASVTGIGRVKGRVKKWKFQGNRFVRPCFKEDEDEEVSIIEDVDVEEIGQVSSAKKIKLDGKLRKEFKGESHYMLMTV